MRTHSRLIVAALLMAVAGAAAAHGRVHFGVQIGPYWGPWWGAPPIYTRPIVIEPEPPIVIDQTIPPVDYWYFCRPANTYYPYIKECPAPWEKVPATPAAQ